MSYFSSEPRSPRGDIHHYPQENQRTAFAIRTASKALVPIAVWNDSTLASETSLGASGQPWIISRLLHISLLISLERYMKIISCIFVKNAFPDGIRQSWSQSMPWWAVYPGVGSVPKMFANAILSLSQHTWSERLSQAEARSPGKSTRTLFWGLKKKKTQKNFISFIVN